MKHIKRPLRRAAKRIRLWPAVDLERFNAKNLTIILFVLITPSVAAESLSEDLEELISLQRIEEDIKNQHKDCLEGSANATEAEIKHELETEYSELNLAADDIAILIAIYADFYNFNCSYLAGDEITNFYRVEFRKRFTHAEIKSLIEFYKSPLGKKLIHQSLEISKEYSNILKERQAVDSFEAQRRYEDQMESFWKRLEKKAAEEQKDHGA